MGGVCKGLGSSQALPNPNINVCAYIGPQTVQDTDSQTILKDPKTSTGEKVEKGNLLFFISAVWLSLTCLAPDIFPCRSKTGRIRWSC